jgi:glycine/D-amino acid oxidase-like deaminating enzyme
MNHPVSYWMRDLGTSMPPVQGDASYDVVVIGGGVTGLSAAWHLARDGASVALVEQDAIGGGSTGRSAGQLAQSSAYDLAELQESFGAERGLELYRSVLSSLRSIRTVITDLRLDCDLRTGGAYYCAAEPTHIRQLEREHAALSRAGIESRLVPVKDYPLDAIYGALRTEGDSSINPSRFARSLSRNLPHTVTVHERSPVTAIHSRRGRQQVSTPYGRITADHVVIATGGWELAGGMRALAVPFVSYIVVTPQLPDEVTARIGDAIMWDTYEMYHYLRRTADNRLLIGGNDSVLGTLRNGAPDHVTAALLRTLRRYVPHPSITAEATWSGTIALPPDGLPVIETRGQRTLLITDGMLMGWLLGRMTADRIRTGRSDFDPLYDGSRTMGFAGNLLRSIPAPRTMKVHLMRLGLAWTVWRLLAEERFPR